MKNLFFLYLIFIFAGCSEAPIVVRTGLEGKPMPSFDLQLSDSTNHLNTASLPLGKPTVVFSFTTHCPYCRAQTEDFISNIEKLNGINLCFITTSPFSAFKEFFKEYDLQNYKNIIAGVDTSYYFDTYLQSNVVPIIAVYDGKKTLKQVLRGKTSIKIIKDIALEQ